MFQRQLAVPIDHFGMARFVVAANGQCHDIRPKERRDFLAVMVSVAGTDTRIVSVPLRPYNGAY